MMTTTFPLRSLILAGVMGIGIGGVEDNPEPVEASVPDELDSEVYVSRYTVSRPIRIPVSPK